MHRLGLGTCLLLLAATVWAQTPQYVAVDLGALKGGSSRVHGINAQAQVVGGSGQVYGDARHAFLGGRGTPMRDLGLLPGGDISEAFAINDAGQVVGTSNTSTGMHAFLWSSTGGLRDLGTLPGAHSSQAFAINSNGQIAGNSGTHAVIWTNGTISDLGGLPDSSWSEAHGINAAGTVVGYSKTRDGERAFVWSAGKFTSIGALPGDTSSRANLINDEGVVIGASSGSSGVRAFRWTASDGMQPLRGLGDGGYSEAFGINSAGQIVGQSGSSLGTHAVMWTAASDPIDLNDVTTLPAHVVLTGAFAINDKGYIVAFGIVNPQGDAHTETRGDVHVHPAGTRAFLLVPR